MEGVQQKVSDFLKNKHCIHHSKKRPTLVCLDYFCEDKGLICPTCLTIKGKHKGHDSVELSDFFEQIEEKFRQSAGLDKKFQQESSELLQSDFERIREFQKIINAEIDNYIEKRTKLHQKRMEELNTSHLIQRCKQVNFNNLEEFNEAIKILSTRLKYKSDTSLQSIEEDQLSYSIEQQMQQIYNEDISGHILIIEKYLLKDLLQYAQNKILTVTPQTSPQFFYPPFYLSENNLPLGAAKISENTTFKGFYENQELIYIGELEKSLPHGKGLTFFRHSGKVYEGEYFEGKMHGKGRVIFQNGDSYTGDFHLDKKQGRGIYVWQEKGNYYEGEFWNSKRHGRGLFISQDGSQYEGNFKDGLQSGMGVLKKKNGEVEYEGQWRAGCFEGKGIQYLPNGDKYNGEFEKDMFSGRGVYTKSEDKTEVHGIWKENQLVVVNQTVNSSQIQERN